jgi:phosphoserine aminotransferase
MSQQRVHNFSAGPAVLPLRVLEDAQKELLNLNGSGMSVMEMSHRSKTYMEIHDGAIEGLKGLLNISDDYKVLLLQGGASLQFSMVPMNLKLKNKAVNVINTGQWTKKAIKEFKKETDVNIIASSEDQDFNYIPSQFSIEPNASFAYLTSNNTIAGTQWHEFPDTEGIPLVADMSSDILSRSFDVSKFGLIFAGAQKNVGPSGVTIVIINEALLSRSSNNLPSMLNYNMHVDNNSLYNTPPTFSIYMMYLVTQWLNKQGGLNRIEKLNHEKAKKIYDLIDGDFYQSPVEKGSRSLMNIVFRIRNDEVIETKFLSEAKEAGLINLKGHRSVGGLRASIYNAIPVESVDALVQFMEKFKSENI